MRFNYFKNSVGDEKNLYICTAFPHRKTVAAVAQLVEHFIRNEKVSSPSLDCGSE